ncbi:MAG: hypothetical protein KDA50_03035 [Rhodobacteraceae bacterium]|nr:hypothetical protein [Paracoccaceae bacterium]
MTRHYFRPIKDETVVSVLHYLRSVVIRDGQSGLEHVDALLRLQGIEPECLPIPDKRPKAFKRGELRALILGLLKGGPQTGRQIAEAVTQSRDNLTFKQSYKRVYLALHVMQKRGMVRRDGGVWRLAP